MIRFALIFLFAAQLMAQTHIAGNSRFNGQVQVGASRVAADLMGLTDFNQAGLESANVIDAMQFTFSDFQQQSPVPHPAADVCSVVYGHKIYVIGGYGANATTYLNYVQIYDPATDQWTQGATMSAGAWGLGCAISGSKIYIFGGATAATGQSGTTVAQVYDIVGNSWSSLNSLPTPCGDGTMALTVGSYIYVMWEGNFWKFDPSGSGGSGSYTALTAAPSAGQVQWAATGYLNVSGDDRVYFLGGSTSAGSGFTNAVYYYSVTNSAWSGAQSAAPYSAHGMIQQAVYNGSIYYLGGYDGSKFYQTLYSYTPATDTWSSALAAMNAFRDGAGGGFNGSTLYAIGGRNTGNTGSPFGIGANESFSIGSSPVVHNFKTIQLYLSGSPSGNVEMGVYADAGSTGPGSLILDAGSIGPNAGWTAIRSLNLSLTPGTRYWLVFLLSAGMTVDYTAGFPSNPSGPSSSPRCYNTQSYGALPSTFPASGINCTLASGMFAEQLTVN